MDTSENCRGPTILFVFLFGLTSRSLAGTGTHADVFITGKSIVGGDYETVVSLIQGSALGFLYFTRQITKGQE